MNHRKLISTVLILLLIVITFNPAAVQAASKGVLVPNLKIITQPNKEYRNGESISFIVTSPNYKGKVEYRVILYNGTTKKTTNLWNTPNSGYYYKNWQPSGNYNFKISWPVSQLEPGAYSMTVLVRRAGSKVPYDSHVNTNSFYIKGDDIQASLPSNLIAECEKVKVNVNVSKNVNFSSQNPLIASVDNDGNVTGVKEGKTLISVKYFDKTIELPVIVYGENTDTDGDGLTDFQELNKYFTNPEKYDTDGDGISDGNWDERREYTYSIKSIQKISKPYTIEYMNDNYQDMRVIKENNNYLECEVVYYPYNTVDDHIYSNDNWRDDYSDMTEFIKPGITTNWDQQMQKDLIKELKSIGIDPDKLTDKELVEKTASWMGSGVKHIMGGWGLFLSYRNGKPEITERAKPWFEYALNAEKNGKDYATLWSFEEKLNNLVYGKQMYYNKTTGECTPSSTYWATVFRALGIPARINVILPVLEQGNVNQQKMVLNNIKNQSIRELIKSQFTSTTGSLSSHYYTEVYVGNRWVNVEYGQLGFNFLSRGITTHVLTIHDVSEADLEKDWIPVFLGERSGLSHPYSLIDISDLYGNHYNENPYFKLLEKKQLAGINKLEFNKNLFVTPNDETAKITMNKTWVMDISEWAWCSKKDIDERYNMLVVIDNGKVRFSNDMKMLFKDMDKGDKNFLNVRIYNDKLLVYLKAENDDKLKKIINNIDESDFYVEGYRRFE